jgi:D-alanyl-D-alanine dipeptidase
LKTGAGINLINQENESMRLARSRQKRTILLLARTLNLVACCCSIAVSTSNAAGHGDHFANLPSPRPSTQSSEPRQAKPLSAPARWRGLIGEFGPDGDILYILEKDGRLCALFKRVELAPLEEVSKNIFKFPEHGPREGQRLVFKRHANGQATQVEVENVAFKRRQVGPEEGAMQLRVKPLRPIPQLLKEARAAQPPKESGDFRAPDLVELRRLDPTIKLDVRYATTNNLFGTVFYSEARAFMQRPAAEALVRVNRNLRQMGYGLLIHDAYRPWYVTRVFWDATPAEKKLFVADPSKGSRHNRGAAVDLTLYDLKAGKPVEMVSTYDETTDRAYPDYPGGTSLQRWHRNLLRAAMEAEGFTVYEAEWWHFDYKDWQKYPIMNVPFDKVIISNLKPFAAKFVGPNFRSGRSASYIAVPVVEPAPQ